jgi:hypothetical protein
MQQKVVVNIHIQQHRVTKKNRNEKNKFYTTVTSYFIEQ